MEPFMNGSYDLVASENNAWDHINTGWMWLRQSQVTADAWAEVLRRDLESVSRDQNRFNEVCPCQTCLVFSRAPSEQKARFCRSSVPKSVAHGRMDATLTKSQSGATLSPRTVCECTSSTTTSSAPITLTLIDLMRHEISLWSVTSLHGD